MANYITILRMALIFPGLIFATSYSSSYNWVALLLFVIAGITDHLDGYIARKTGSTSSFGALLDLVADKLLIIITLFYFISYSSSILLIIPSQNNKPTIKSSSFLGVLIVIEIESFIHLLFFLYRTVISKGSSIETKSFTDDGVFPLYFIVWYFEFIF